MKHKILVASTNPGKIAELRACLDADVQWLGLSDFDNIPEIIEDGTSFAENARKKATGYAKATGCWTIADDSGLVVDALDGAPGVMSARFSGEKTDDRGLLDHKNMDKVLKLLEGIADAGFQRCVGGNKYGAYLLSEWLNSFKSVDEILNSKKMRFAFELTPKKKNEFHAMMRELIEED